MSPRDVEQSDSFKIQVQELLRIGFCSEAFLQELLNDAEWILHEGAEEGEEMEENPGIHFIRVDYANRGLLIFYAFDDKTVLLKGLKPRAFI